MKVASHADDKLFIAAHCSVQAMDNIWYDKLDPEKKGPWNWLRIIIGIISLGLLAPLLVPYRQSKKVSSYLN